MLEPGDPLDQLNAGFREYYAARQRAVVATVGPAMACVEDWLYLRIEGRRFVGPARAREYHELKVICHLPLAIQAILGDAGGALDDETRGRLEELDRRAAAVLEGLDERPLTAEQIERQRRILTESRGFIAAATRAGEVDEAGLHAFLRARMPDIRENIADAARAQVATLHATVSGWVATMTAEQWSRLRVVVGSAHMARTGNVAAQYFSLALGDSWEGRFETEDEGAQRRVLTSEDALDEESAFMLLATHVFDRRAANAFFGEEGRLGRDVMADAAEVLLGEMFGRRPRPK